MSKSSVLAAGLAAIAGPEIARGLNFSFGSNRNYASLVTAGSNHKNAPNQRQYRKLVRQNPHLRKSKKYRNNN